MCSGKTRKNESAKNCTQKNNTINWKEICSDKT